MKKMIDTAYRIVTLPALVLVVLAGALAVAYCVVIVLLCPPFWGLGRRKVREYQQSIKRRKAGEEAEKQYWAEEERKAKGE